jgi:hypothetical protein
MFHSCVREAIISKGHYIVYELGFDNLGVFVSNSWFTCVILR